MPEYLKIKYQCQKYKTIRVEYLLNYTKQLQQNI